jgi:putative spermidine/putrescine transport system permease protein
MAMLSDETRLTGRRWLLLAPALAAVVALLGIPVLMLVRSSFLPTEGPLYKGGWSLRHYRAFFQDSYFVEVLFETLTYGVVVAVGTALIGFPLAYSLARASARARRLRFFILILPLSLSLVVNVFGWMVILGRAGFANNILLFLGLVSQPLQLLYNRTAVLIVLGHTFLPFQVLSIMSVIAQIDPVLEQAAASLRADRWTTFRRVVIPLAWPGVLAGSTIVFMLTISAFVTPRFIGGTKVPMLGSLVYEQVLIVLNWPFAAAMSVILLVIALLIAAAAGRATRPMAAR